MEPGTRVQGGRQLSLPLVIAGVVAFVLVVTAGGAWFKNQADERAAAAAEAARLAEEERIAEEQRVAEEQRLAEEQRILEAEAARARAEEFVRRATEGVEYEATNADGISMHISWRINFESLNGSWAWRETQQMAAAEGSSGVGVVEELSFWVDSTQLAHPLRIEPHDARDDWYTVVMECNLLAQCITVQGRRVVGVMQYGQMQQEEERVSERRASQSWVYRDRATAERASNALADMLKHAGAPERAY
jgi:hypothetical protein